MILLIPSVRKHNGSGHFRRCLETAASRKKFLILIRCEKDSFDYRALLENSPLEKERILFEFPQWSRISMVVFDQAVTSEALYNAIPTAIPCICLDEGGPLRAQCDYSLDIIPPRSQLGPANERNFGFLKLPQNRRKGDVAADNPDKVLISFGGEDSAGLASRTAAALESHISIYTTHREAEDSSTAVYYECRENLREKLYEFDTVITHFGLTALEALHAGCRVILIDPTAVHAELAETWGFPHLEAGKLNHDSLKTLLKEALIPLGLLHEMEEPGRLSLGDYLLKPLNYAAQCRFCGCEAITPEERYPHKTYYRCPCCGGTSLSVFFRKSVSYEHDYFNKEYEAHYGRTYVEDFSQIREFSRGRIAEIKKIHSAPAILDIGCAYGPFIDAARQEGLPAAGLDISRDAVDYVREKLGLFAQICDFENTPEGDIPLPDFKINTITMWFVFEHFNKPGIILDKLYTMLPEGGILALSTPNGRGISAKKSWRNFLECSPDDHFTVICPEKLKRLLEKKGFIVKKTVMKGIHRNRFPFIMRIAPKRLLNRWGDTFEIYAVKRETKSF